MYKGGHVLKRLVSAGNDKRYIVNRGSNRPQDLVLPERREEETGVRTDRKSSYARAAASCGLGNNNESKGSGDIFFDASSSCGEGGRLSSSGLDADTWDCEVSHAEISLSCTQDMMRTCKDTKSTYMSRGLMEKVINEDRASSSSSSSCVDWGLSESSEEPCINDEICSNGDKEEEGGEAEMKKKEEEGGGDDGEECRCKSSALTESNLLINSSPRPAHGITLDMKSESLQRLTTDVLLRKGPRAKGSKTSLPSGSKKDKNAPAPVNVSPMQEAGKKIIHAPNLKSYYVSQYSKAYDRVQRMKELESLREVFKYVDTDNSGNVDLTQFLSFMKSKEIQRIMATRFGFQPHQSEIIFRAIDICCDGNINLEDWETYCTSRMESIAASGDGPADFFITSCRDTSKGNDTTKAAPRQPFKARPLKQYKSVVKPNDPNTTLHASKWFFNLNPCQLPKCEKRSEC